MTRLNSTARIGKSSASALAAIMVFMLIGLLAGTGRAEGQGTPPTTQPATPELPGFRTVANAIVAKVGEQAPLAAARTGYLGVVADSADGKLRVENVEAGSPAAMAGVEEGDLILSLDGQAVASAAELRQALQSRNPGERVSLRVVRKGAELELSATLAATSRPLRLGGRRAIMGVQLGEETEAGAPVKQVTPGLPAEQAGLKEGDVLVKFDGVTLNGSAKVSDNLAQKQPGDAVVITFRREGKESELKITLVADKGAADPRNVAAAPTGIFKKDVYRLAMICVEFPDLAHNEKISAGDWDAAMFSTGAYNKTSATGQTVYGSLNDYYLEQSCGGLRVEGKVFDWVQVSKPRGDYAQGSGPNSHTPFLTEAMDLLLKREGDDALKDFDGVLFLYSGDRFPTSNRGSLYWPHKGNVQFKGKRWTYFICAEGGSRMATNSVFCHEFGHMLGLPDLYARPENPGSVGLGVWCAMSVQSPGGRPQHFSAWCKEQMGWLKPTVIDPTVKQKIVLAPVEGSTSECIKVLIRSDGSEYLLLENRRKTGFDASLPGEGLLIWRVANNRPVLEASHGIDGPAGPMVFTSSVPFPSGSNNAFTPYTTPSSRSVLGGGLPVYLTNIHRLPDGRITFYVGYEFQ